MYPHQIERLTGAAGTAPGCEALVATSAANVAYVTGFRRSRREPRSHSRRIGHLHPAGNGTGAAGRRGAVGRLEGLEVDHVVVFRCIFRRSSGTADGMPAVALRSILDQRAAEPP